MSIFELARASKNFQPSSWFSFISQIFHANVPAIIVQVQPETDNNAHRVVVEWIEKMKGRFSTQTKIAVDPNKLACLENEPSFDSSDTHWTNLGNVMIFQSWF